MTAPTEQPAPSGVEITDEMVVAYFDVSGSAAWEREIEALSGWPRTEYMVRAGLTAVVPLIATQVRAELAAVGPLLPEGGETRQERVPDLPCPKCGNGDVTMRYCDGCRRRLTTDECRHGDLEHLHRFCRRCRYEWHTNDVPGAKVRCPD